jgi:two-component system sensor histidine kinase HydH
MRILSIKKMYFPALTLVAVVFLLLILISISTYRNLNRDKTRELDSLHRQGVVLLRSIEASVRTGMKMLMWQEVSLGNLLQETAKDQDIDYVMLIDEHGNIVHHSDPIKKGVSSHWKPIISGEDQVVTRVFSLPDHKTILELAKIFAPMYEPAMTHSRSDMMGFGQIESPHSHRGDIMVLGIRMTAYEEARSADVQHAFIMAAIILVLGSGAFFFIFVIQNYYLVDKALTQTKDYTREVVANMANGLISLDPKGKIVSFNLLALELLDIEESEAKGMDLRASIDFESSGIQSTITDCIPVLEYEILHQKKSLIMVRTYWM